MRGPIAVSASYRHAAGAAHQVLKGDMLSVAQVLAKCIASSSSWMLEAGTLITFAIESREISRPEIGPADVRHVKHKISDEVKSWTNRKDPFLNG